MTAYDGFDRFHVRKSPRCKHCNYTRPGYYFVTVCAHEKRCIFGKPGKLSAFGRCAYDAFSEISAHFPAVTVDKFVIMPNHIHAIIVIREAGVNLSLVIGHYKAWVTKQIRRITPKQIVWQTSFHDHVIRNEADYRRIWQYIDGNPARWEEDCFFSCNGQE